MAMATSRGLTSTFSSLTITPRPCLRNIPSHAPQTSAFSTSRLALGGPIARYRREKAHQKLRKAKERAEQLRIERSARSDPVIGHVTSFTSSLLRHRDLLPKPNADSHTRSEEENWPMLTNFGISSEDTLILSQGARDAEARRLKTQGVVRKRYSSEQKFLFDAKDTTTVEQKMRELEIEDQRKREVMAKLIDLANGNSKAVIDANMEKAILHFGRHDGDTGSPEVQAGVLTVRIMALHEHMKRNSQDKQTKRALHMMVHQRQKLLKYLRRTKPEQYFACLKDIGLDDSAIVAEVR